VPDSSGGVDSLFARLLAFLDYYSLVKLTPSVIRGKRGNVVEPVGFFSRASEAAMFKIGAIFCLLVLLVAVVSAYSIHFRLGSEALNAWGAYLSGCGALALALAAIIGGFLAISDYRTRALAEKSKWFLQLYEKLFENPQYKEVRRKLDYGETDEIKMLIQRDAQGLPFTEAEQGKFDAFTDYLNFFEFIAHLKEIGQLSAQDIKATFDYYLTLLTKARNPEIRQYLKKEGFENLDRLLLEYEKDESQVQKKQH
jgi:hypothetical protein